MFTLAFLMILCLNYAAPKRKRGGHARRSAHLHAPPQKANRHCRRRCLMRLAAPVLLLCINRFLQFDIKTVQSSSKIHRLTAPQWTVRLQRLAPSHRSACRSAVPGSRPQHQPQSKPRRIGAAGDRVFNSEAIFRECGGQQTRLQSRACRRPLAGAAACCLAGVCPSASMPGCGTV